MLSHAVLISVLLTSLGTISDSAVGHSSRRNNPLIGEDGRKRLRSNECHFGKSIKELGTTWFADLGPPFYVMYCIRCECVPVQKKRRIVAKVQCRNIQRECPVPSCDEPVLLPGQCCKLCPGDRNGSELALDIPIVEEDKNIKYFGALLTPRSSLTFKRDDIVNIPSFSDSPKYQIVATGRFTFHKKNLYYSFYLANTLGEAPPRPRTIQFINFKGDLLGDLPLSASAYQNATGKVCGVWPRLPREYKKLLRDEGLYVALLWGTDLALSGQISRFKALNSEHYTALMAPPVSLFSRTDGGGGTAVISVSTLAATNSIHMTLLFNGLFTPGDVADVPLTFRLIDNGEKLIYEEVIRVTKPSTNLNQAEVQFSLPTNDFRLLARGRVSITLSSKSQPDYLNVRGVIMSRATCEVFQAPLTPASGLTSTSNSGPVAGLVWMYITPDGSLVYNWETDRPDDNSVLSLLPSRGGKTLQILNATVGSHTFDKITARTMEMLYGEELSVEMTLSTMSRLQGALIARPVAGALDASAPVLLTRQPSVSTRIAGLAWITVDFECDLHYEVQLTGVEDYKMGLQLYLEDTPMIAPNAPVSRRKLEDFNGTLLEGFAQLTPQEATRIDSGIGFFKVFDIQTGQLLLRANMKPVRIPSECLASTSDNDVPYTYSQSAAAAPANPSLVEVNKCYHEGRFYDEGTQWRHSRDPCRMCHCMRTVHCDEVICPALNCLANNTVAPAKDQCCPSCSNGSTGTSENTAVGGCLLGGQFYPAGSSWHPYLPPHGFNLCTVMSCDAATLNVRYTRVHCPALRCPERDQVFPNSKACCKQCVQHDADTPHDQELTPPRPKTAEEIMKEGGCMYLKRGPYENNTEWAHSIPSVGTTPCIRCHCKNGKVGCERKQCPRSQCNATSNSTLQHLSTPMDECCSTQCRRYRRQSRNRHRKV